LSSPNSKIDFNLSCNELKVSSVKSTRFFGTAITISSTIYNENKTRIKNSKFLILLLSNPSLLNRLLLEKSYRDTKILFIQLSAHQNKLNYYKYQPDSQHKFIFRDIDLISHKISLLINTLNNQINEDIGKQGHNIQ